MLRNSKEIETNQHNNTPTNDGFIETELKAETPSSQDTEKTESDINNYMSSSESENEQDEAELKSETSSSQSSQDTENAGDANYYLSSSDSSSSESEQEEKSQQASAGFGLLPNFMKSLLSSLFGGNSPDADVAVIEIEVVVPPLPVLSHLIDEVHSEIHLLQIQQAILLGQQKELAEIQQKLAVKQQEIAKEINQSGAKEVRMQADLGRFYGKRMTFFCETGKPTQLVNVQANDEEKKNENDSDSDNQSSLRASM